MSRRIDFTLTENQLEAVEKAINHSPLPEVRQRATAIRLPHLGHKPEAVAEMVAVALSTIWNWHRRYRAGSVNGLANRVKSGRPTKTDANYVSAVESALASDPCEIGDACSVWTINKLRRHLAKQTGILLNYTRFRALLHKYGYVYRQPKHDLSDLQDADAKAAAEEFLDWLKKSPSPTTPPSSSFVDETSVSLHPILRRCWMKRGHRKTIAAPGTPRYRHTFGAYNWRDGRVSAQTKDRKNSESFIEFIEYIMLEEYPDVKVVMVLDNASYHRSRASLAAFDLFDERLHMIWLPHYCPFLNAIERFWLQLKNLAAANCLHRDLDDLIQAIARVIHNQNLPEHPNRLDFAQNFRLMA